MAKETQTSTQTPYPLLKGQKPEHVKTWSIEITPNNADFAPSYFDNSYPFFGNKEHMAAMVNINLIDPNVIVPGPALAALTAGTQAGAVTTLIRSVLDIAPGGSGTYSFAIGGNQLYIITATAVSQSSTPPDWPHTIVSTIPTDTVVGEDVAYYQNLLFYFWNDTTTNDGDIGMWNFTTTFDDTWGSTVVANGQMRLSNAPHQAVSVDNRIYFANGNYMGYIQYISTATPAWSMDSQALQMPQGQISSICYNLNNLYIALNTPNYSGQNFNQSSIYLWDGRSVSWQTNPLTINGLIGALYAKLGVVYVWWQEGGTANRYNFGYYTGTALTTLKTYSGTLPQYYQVSEYKGFISWVSGGKLYMWGNSDPAVTARSMQYCQSTYGTSGGMASPFGVPFMASTDGGSNFILEQPGTTYSVNSSYNTIAFKTSSGDVISQLDSIQIETDPIGEGAKLDFQLNINKNSQSFYSQGISPDGGNVKLEQIVYTEDAPTIWKIMNNGPIMEDMQFCVNFSKGSATSPVKIRRVFLSGHYLTNP